MLYCGHVPKETSWIQAGLSRSGEHEVNPMGVKNVNDFRLRKERNSMRWNPPAEIHTTSYSDHHGPCSVSFVIMRATSILIYIRDHRQYLNGHNTSLITTPGNRIRIVQVTVTKSHTAGTLALLLRIRILGISARGSVLTEAFAVVVVGRPIRVCIVVAVVAVWSISQYCSLSSIN